ncbi:MAG: hypothetical protein MUO67_03215 [Anaerolineales bacterium]|nr:hypothetical protein [Anaerolineales bacterium]
MLTVALWFIHAHQFWYRLERLSMRHFIIQHVGDVKQIGQSHTLRACVAPRSGKPVRMPDAWGRGFAAQISKE